MYPTCGDTRPETGDNLKIVTLIARILLGLIFFVFGLNGFLHFIPSGPLPTGLAGQFAAALFQSHYILFVSACQTIGGLLVLINRYAVLGLVILGPILVNILLFHALLLHAGWPIGTFASILWLVLAYHARRHLAGIFAPRMEA